MNDATVRTVDRSETKTRPASRLTRTAVGLVRIALTVQFTVAGTSKLFGEAQMMTDLLRSEQARRRREQLDAERNPPRTCSVRRPTSLYDVLGRIKPDPMVTLNAAVAVAMVRGPAAGLELIDTVAADPKLADHHRLAAVRAHLLEQAGDLPAARSAYADAARRTTSLPEQRYLHARAARLNTNQ